jgi:hypothetical protein
MNKWLVTTIILICFIPCVFSLDSKEVEDKFQAYQRINTVWRSIEAIELVDERKIIPHAILYGGGTEMDVFVTFSAGLFKFVTHEVEAPQKSLPWYWNCYNYGSHILNWNYFSWFCRSSSRYYTHEIDLSFTSSTPAPFTAKTWNCDDSKGIMKIYATDESAVFRLSFGTRDQASLASLDNVSYQDILSAYIQRSLNAGIKIAYPTEYTQKVDWRTSPEIIPYLIKSLNNKYIKYVTRPQYKLFQSAVQECRIERARNGKH